MLAQIMKRKSAVRSAGMKGGSVKHTEVTSRPIEMVCWARVMLAAVVAIQDGARLQVVSRTPVRLQKSD